MVPEDNSWLLKFIDKGPSALTVNLRTRYKETDGTICAVLFTGPWRGPLGSEIRAKVFNCEHHYLWCSLTPTTYQTICHCAMVYLCSLYTPPIYAETMSCPSV